jgi:hypothetical protein
MGWNTFARSAVFAALAGFGVAPWLLLAGPLLGMRWALTFYLVALAAISVLVFAPSLRRGLAACAAVSVLGGCVAVTTRTLPELALSLAVLLATARAVFLYRRRSARAVALEGGLIGGGLLLARFLAGPSLVSIMLALWGFLLVQSFFFLVPGARVRERAAPQRDPFDAAYERARALLDGLPI